jgi:hypothetical protein
MFSPLIRTFQLSESQVVNLRAELLEEIMAKLVPENIISNVTKILCPVHALTNACWY